MPLALTHTLGKGHPIKWIIKCLNVKTKHLDSFFFNDIYTDMFNHVKECVFSTQTKYKTLVKQWR